MYFKMFAQDGDKQTPYTNL
jgi:hypothetical protein